MRQVVGASIGMGTRRVVTEGNGRTEKVAHLLVQPSREGGWPMDCRLVWQSRRSRPSMHRRGPLHTQYLTDVSAAVREPSLSNMTLIERRNFACAAVCWYRVCDLQKSLAFARQQSDGFPMVRWRKNKCKKPRRRRWKGLLEVPRSWKEENHARSPIRHPAGGSRALEKG